MPPPPGSPPRPPPRKRGAPHAPPASSSRCPPACTAAPHTQPSPSPFVHEQACVFTNRTNTTPVTGPDAIVTLRLLRSVDVELVAFRVFHPDRVVVEPFFGQCASDGGAQASQPAGLRIDSLLASFDRVRPLATGVDVEVQPVLYHLGIRDDMEPDARPVTLRIADPVRPVDQFLLGHPQVAVEVVPGNESIRDRRELIAQRSGPEPS